MEGTEVGSMVINVPLASLLAFGLCYAGMAALSLAMEKHHVQVWQIAHGHCSRSHCVLRAGP